MGRKKRDPTRLIRVRLKDAKCFQEEAKKLGLTLTEYVSLFRRRINGR